MAKPARRRCKNDECREWFHPAFANQWWCSPECGTKIALERRSKEREKAGKAAEKKRRREDQRQKDKLKIRKLALKPRSYWIKQAQQAVNAFIRERDRDLPCISCGTLTSAQWDAGHYRTTAAAPQLRFDERNIHKQCVVCNQHKSGNLVPYPGRNYPRPNSTENASGIHLDAMPSMIAIILLIILHIWLCRQGGDHFWSESRLNISLLMLDVEHLARGKGLR